MKKQLFTLIGILSMALAMPVVAGDSAMLGYNPAEGSEFKWKVKFSQEAVFQGFAFMDFAEAEVTEKVVSKSDDGIMMEATFDKVSASREQFGKLQENEVIQGLAGKSVTFRIDGHGKVEDLEPMEHIEGWDTIKDRIETLLNYTYLPNTEKSKGDEWDRNDEEKISDDLTQTIEGHFKFEEMTKEKGRECAKIVSTGKNMMTGVDPQTGGDLNGSGEVKSEMLFDAKNSVIVKLKTKVEMKMEVTPPGGEVIEGDIFFEVERELI